jgi:hypothetical protein
MFEGDGIHHHSEKQNQDDLREDIETDPKPANSFSRKRSGLLRLTSHGL